MAPKDLSVTSDMAVADSLCVAGFGAEWARGTRDNADSLDSKTSLCYNLSKSKIPFHYFQELGLRLISHINTIKILKSCTLNCY